MCVGGGFLGLARQAEELPGESRGVGDAPRRVDPLLPVGVNGARPGVNRARREALEAEVAGAARRRFGGVVLREARIPVHPERGAGAWSSAVGSRVGEEGVVLLIGPGSCCKGVGGPCNGGSCGGSVRGCEQATPGRGRPATVRGRPVGLWGGSSSHLARGTLLLARWGSSVLSLGSGDQGSN